MKVIRYGLFISFFGAVSYFTFRGFQQMLEKPISTKTDFRFGDDSRGNLSMFVITICPESNFSPFLNGFKSQNYSLANILKDSIASWNISEKLKYQSLADGSKYTYQAGMNNQWVPRWHLMLDWKYGHCYTFQPNENEVKTVPIIAHGRSSKSQAQILAMTMPAEFMVTIFEPKGKFTLAKNEGNNIIHFWPATLGRLWKYRVKKYVINSISTDDNPCELDQLYYGKMTCIEGKATERFLEQTGCVLPWMKLIQPDSQICQDEDSIFKAAFQDYLCAIHEINPVFSKENFEKKCYSYIGFNCQEFRSCHEVIIEQTLMTSKPDPDGETILQLYWQNPRITYVEDFVSYDLHNLIGEVGGFLGLFLGFSFTSIFTWMEWILTQKQNMTFFK